MMRPWIIALLAAPSVLWGCGAQSENFDDKDWTVEHGAESGAWREVESLGEEEETSDPEAPFHSLRGVRQDLVVAAKAPPDVECQCLDVSIGQPRDPKFRWSGERPTIGGQLMVLAIRPKPGACSGNDKNRPSIQGVVMKGDDVTVVVEQLAGARPQALGAIIKKPGANGGLYVRRLGDKQSCRVPHTVEMSETGGRHR